MASDNPSNPGPNPPKYQYGDLNPVYDGLDQDELDAKNYADDEVMFDYVKHAIVKNYQRDVFKGMTKFKAIVLTAPGVNLLEDTSVPSIPAAAGQPKSQPKKKKDEGGLLSKIGKWFGSGDDDSDPTPTPSSTPSLSPPPAVPDALVPPELKQVFKFRARIPEVHASLPDPCDAIPSIGGGPVPASLDPKVISAIMMHPEFIAKTDDGMGGTLLAQPGIGDIVEIEFEKGPSGGRLIGGTYVRLIKKNPFNGIEQVCEAGLSNLFDGPGVVTGDCNVVFGKYQPGMTIMRKDNKNTNGGQPIAEVLKAPRCATYVGSFGPSQKITNGSIPPELYGKTREGHELLLGPAIEKWHQLSDTFNAHFNGQDGRPKREFPGNGNLRIRKYETQVDLRINKGTIAARPGKSNHGWGMAIDIDRQKVYGTRNESEIWKSKEYEWLLKNAPNFGWHHPEWAQQGGGNPESWHWEILDQGSYIILEAE